MALNRGLVRDGTLFSERGERGLSDLIPTFLPVFCRNMKTSPASNLLVTPSTDFSKMKIVISELQKRQKREY